MLREGLRETWEILSWTFSCRTDVGHHQLIESDYFYSDFSDDNCEGRFINGFTLKIETSFVPVILLLLCVVGVTGRYSFIKLGTFHQHVSYARVGVSFDFGPFSMYVASIVKSLEDVRYARMSDYGKATVSRLLVSVHEIDERLSG